MLQNTHASCDAAVTRVIRAMGLCSIVLHICSSIAHEDFDFAGSFNWARKACTHGPKHALVVDFYLGTQSALV